MTPTETATILRQFNEWRLCNDEDLTQLDPKQITAAIGAAIEMIERAESDLATAEQDSRQKQARIERLTEALSILLNDLEERAKWNLEEDQRVVACGNSVYVRAKAALEESK